MYEEGKDYKKEDVLEATFLVQGVLNQKVYRITNDKGTTLFTSSDGENYKCVNVVVYDE